MSKIAMFPCKLREDRLVPVKGAEPVEFTEVQVIAKFGLNMQLPTDLYALRALAPASYIGLVTSRSSGQPIRFFLRNDNLSGDVAWILKGDPTFADRLLEAWLVEKAEWDSKVMELPT